MGSFFGWTGRYGARLLLGAIGMVFLVFSLIFLFDLQLKSSAAVFSVAFFCFLFADSGRFESFKGLGFEAKLWEQKKEEANALIDQLKNVVAINSREMIINKVVANRFADAYRWRDAWKLYESLVASHSELDAQINFASLKKQMDDYFLFDLCSAPSRALQRALWNKRAEADRIIADEFPGPITTEMGVKLLDRRAKLTETDYRIDNGLEISKRENLAQVEIDAFRRACEKMKTHFDLEVEANPEAVDRISKIADLYRNRPVKLTPEILLWSEEKWDIFEG